MIAADVIDSIADNQALIQKKIKLLDLTTDGPALAESLRRHAKTLRDLVNDPLYDDSGFDIAEQIQYQDTPAWAEKILKDIWSQSA
jgi:hypothetical protein